jgi:hypothetical protein
MTDIYGDTTGVQSTSPKRTQRRTTALGFGTAPCALRPDGRNPPRRRARETEVQQRSAAAEKYEQLGRDDLVERLHAEADVLRRHLPAAQ